MFSIFHTTGLFVMISSFSRFGKRQDIGNTFVSLDAILDVKYPLFPPVFTSIGLLVIWFRWFDIFQFTKPFAHGGFP